MTKKMGIYLLFFTLSTGLAWTGTPEELVEHSFLLLKDGKYDQVAALYEVQSIQSFREALSFIHELPEDTAIEILGSLGVAEAPADLRARTDTQFMAAFVGGIMGQAKELGEVSMEMKVLGTVPENDTVSHVITRVNLVIGELSMESMDVESTKKTAEGYRLLVDLKMMATAAQYRAIFMENDP